jgi:hypothetical protein
MGDLAHGITSHETLVLKESVDDPNMYLFLKNNVCGTEIVRHVAATRYYFWMW